MCVAIAKPKGSKLPNRDILKVCFKNNPDGAGFVFNRDGKNHIYKGFFTFADFWRAIESQKIQDDEGALIHFRVATHGGISKGTCHPFLICKNFEWMRMDSCTFAGDVLIHNGQLNFAIDQPNISDSMMLAKSLFKYNRTLDENQFFLEMALINNDTKKINRVAIIDVNGNIELYGHKEPWKDVDGCFYSNESYKINFSRTTYYNNSYYNNQTVTKEQADKFDYDEDACISTKFSLCENRENGCKNIATCEVFFDDSKSKHYCEKCIKDIETQYCKYCHKIKTLNNFSNYKNICDCCIKNKEEFFSLIHCDCCESSSSFKKVVVAKENNEYVYRYLCEKCCKSFNIFHCDDCNIWFSEAFLDSHYHNLCIGCYTKLTEYNKSCTYCKKTTDLYKAAYSTICSKCLQEKKAIRCAKCKKISLYTEKNYGEKFGICSTCKTNVKHILECFKLFNLLNDENKKFIIKQFDNMTKENQIKILNFYDSESSIFNCKSIFQKIKDLENQNNLFNPPAIIEQ